MSLKSKLNTKLKYKFLEIILILGLGWVVMFSILSILDDSVLSRHCGLWTGHLVMAAFILIGAIVRGEKFKDFGLSIRCESFSKAAKSILWSILILALVAFGFGIASQIQGSIFPGGEGIEFLKLDFTTMDWWESSLVILLILFCSSFCSELIYRAFIINRVMELSIEPKQMERIALITSTLVFGLIYWFIGPFALVQTLFVGFALAIAYIKLAGNLWILIFTHIIIDLVLIFQFY